MRAGRTLRRIVMDRIIAHVPDLGGRVFDMATKGVDHPYATLGPSYWVDDSTECIDARETTLQVDLWHDSSSKGELEDLVDDVTAALKGWADTVSLTMHPVEISLVQIMDDPDGVSVHGVIQIEAMVEADGNP
ncbi:DUF3168 domain-containing protein [Paracoccus litorisediminis]|uniref:DUF3168 domain-containing protein n=2 Tax=Paracoccus litorisediminis TaxID=2006130 RepID=A0A844HV63_9RHOB|nr:DUF3168 domain-containing protein [Paracoccus litorisediminis]